MNHTLTVSISLGGDIPTWEGDATCTYSVYWGRSATDTDPAEDVQVTNLRITHVDDVPVDHLQYSDTTEVLCDHIIDFWWDDLIDHVNEEERAAHTQMYENQLFGGLHGTAV
jgi:hypothetical protein